MYSDIKITVIIFGNGNTEQLRRCLESVTCQTHELYECFIMLRENSAVNRDEIESLIDGRFSVMTSTENANDNMMFGQEYDTKCSASKYTVCIDGSDWIEIDYLKQMIEAIEHSDKADVVCGGTILEKQIGIVDSAVWNKIFQARINWDAMKICHTYDASYHRCGQLDLEFTGVRDYDSRLDELKRAVFDPQYKYISFDVFDTVVQRPFYDPQDLFDLLDIEYEKNAKTNISFAKIRKLAEADLRQKITGMTEDITIDEIYDNVVEMFRIAPELADKLKAFERELEIKYTSCRDTGKEIFELARRAQKQIIFISDMYLDHATVEKILLKNGYDGYLKLFLSSEYRKLKGTGNLYKCVIKELQVKPEEILHIGDNYVKDVQCAMEEGISAYHFPSALSRFDDHDYIKGKNVASVMTKKLCGGFISYEKMMDSIGYRCMLAQVANKCFDNPYIHYSARSLLNQDPYVVGYYLVGSYLIALNKWIEETVRGKYSKIYFTSRDGYLPMLAYRIMKEYRTELPEEEYFYTSRQCVLSAMLKEKMDFYDLPIDRARYSPRKLFELLEFATDKDIEQWRQICEKKEIPIDDLFESDAQMISLITIFLDEFYSREKHMRSITFIRGYYDRIRSDSIMFDMGYSGRIQAAISELAGDGIDVMFVHSDSKLHDRLERRGKFKIYSFFDFVPQMSDVLREYLLSAPAPTCVGYIYEGAEYHPVLDQDDMTEKERGLIETIHKGALDFVKEFYHNFGEVLDYLPYKFAEMALPMEGFLRYNNDDDRTIFSDVKFDDVLYGGERAINLKELVELASEWLPNYAEEEQ